MTHASTHTHTHTQAHDKGQMAKLAACDNIASCFLLHVCVIVYVVKMSKLNYDKLLYCRGCTILH